jgi:hypothetical protein
MEAEAENTQILFEGEGDWKITGIINNDGNVKINGNIFSIDRELIRENYTLSLEGLGRLESLWTTKGFVISRISPRILNIELMENSSGQDFNFTIQLQSGNETKDIVVEQKKSQGYEFKNIEYSLRENDGDSLFVKMGEKIKFDIPSPQEFSFSPFNGININRSTFFQSNEKNAFIWLEDTLKVQVPSSIAGSTILTSGQKEFYTDLTTVFPHGFEQEETVIIRSGKSELFTIIEFRRRRVSYTLNLINNRTGEEKRIEGKWVEIAPTGEYEIQLD